MLIRFGGGIRGIKEYLETGRKQGRKESRGELDERVILSGDLDLVDRITRLRIGKGQNYLHITLSFKEDHIDHSVLAEIVRDFEAFSFAAYRKDEYAFYAEAHLPRIKTSIDGRTTKTVQRKPHIHIVIPKINLLSNQHLNPFGMTSFSIRYIDTFQEHMNQKYGLASPKDNCRLATEGKAEILSRSKGDVFKPGNRVLKAKLAALVMQHNITSYNAFIELITEYGEVTIRHEGTPQEYINLCPYGQPKGMNLRDSVFKRAFIELPMIEKHRHLGKQLDNCYGVAGNVKALEGSAIAIIDEWKLVHSREIKYLNSGNRKIYREYMQSDSVRKGDLLAGMETRFYQKHLRLIEVETPRIEPSKEPIDEDNSLTFDESAKTAEAGQDTFLSGRVENVIAQWLHDLNAAEHQSQEEKRPDIRFIKQQLSAEFLLQSLSLSHGLETVKYASFRTPDGAGRIICGNRRLNVCDFLTKEMHFSWTDAQLILKAVWDQQQMFHQSQGKTAEESVLGRTSMEQQVLGANKIDPELKGSAVEIQTERLERDDFASQQDYLAYLCEFVENDPLPTPVQLQNRKAIEDMESVFDGGKYSPFFESNWDNIIQSKYVDEDVLEFFFEITPDIRLDRMIGVGYSDGGSNSNNAPIFRLAKDMLRQMTYRKHANGNVSWYHEGALILRDCSNRVQVFEQSDASIELAFLLAIKKFGRNLNIYGNWEFQVKAAKVAGTAGLDVELFDPDLNVIMLRFRDHYHPELRQRHDHDHRDEGDWDSGLHLNVHGDRGR